MPENNSDDIEKLLDQVDQLNRLNEQLSSTIDNSGKALSGTADTMRSIVSEATRNLQVSKEDYKNRLQIVDATEAVAVAKRKIAHHESKTSLFSGQYAQIWRDNLKALEDFTTEQEKSIKIQEMAVESADELANNVLGIFDKIPIGGRFLSRALGIDEIKNKLSTDLTQNFKSFFNKGEDTAGNLKDVFTKSFKSIGAALKNAFAPLTLITILALAAIQRFRELDKAGEDFRKTVGFTVSQTYDLSNNVKIISRDLRDFGVRMEDVYKSAAVAAAEFDNAAFITKDLLETSALLAANYGIGEELTAKTVQNFMQLSGDSAETASNLSKATVVAAKFAGVAPKQVMSDIANASETTLVMMRGNSKEMARTAIEARLLGTNLESVTKSARTMLNFQESISAEMEAATLLGKNLNFQASRQAAFQGDAGRARELAIDQIQKAGDLTRMNAFQQEALSKATGMTVVEMQKQINRREQLDKLRTSDLDKYQKMMSYEKALNSMNEDSIDKEFQRMEMQSKQAQMMNQLMSIWVELSDVIVPIVDLLANVLVPTLKLFAWGVGIILYPLTAISQLIGSITTEMKEWSWIQNVAKWIDGLSAATDNWFGKLVKFTVGSTALYLLFSKKFLNVFPAISSAAGRAFSGITGHMSKMIKSIPVVGKLFGTKEIIKSAESSKKALSSVSSTTTKAAADMSKNANKVSKSSVGMFSRLGKGIKSMALNIGKSMQTVASSMKNSMKSIASGIGQSTKTLFKSIGDSMKSIASGIGQSISTLANSLSKSLISIGKGIGGFLNELSKSVGSSLKSLGKGVGGFVEGVFSGLSRGLKSLSNPRLLIGVGVLTGLSAAVWLVAKSFKQFNDIDWGGVFIGLGGLALFATTAGIIGNPTTIGFVLAGVAAIGLLGLALIPIAYSMKLFSESMETVVNSLSNLSDKTSGLFKVSMGIGTLSASLIAFSASATLLAASTPAILVAGASLVFFSGVIITVSGSFMVLSKGLQSVVELSGEFIPMINRLVSSSSDLFVVASGITAISAAIASMGVGQAIGSVGNFISGLFGQQSPIEKLISFSKQADRLGESSSSVVSLIDSFSGLEDITNGINKLTESIITLNDVLRQVSEFKLNSISTTAKITTVNDDVNTVTSFISPKESKRTSDSIEEKVQSSNETNKLLTELITLFKDGSIAVNLDKTKTIGALSAK